MESANNSQSVRFFVILGVFLMYISSDVDQITMEEFFMPFGGKLLKTNRWVKLASMMPWEHIERIYMASFQSERGRPAISSRIAFGSIFIKENDNLTDEGSGRTLIRPLHDGTLSQAFPRGGSGENQRVHLHREMAGTAAER